MTGADKDLAGGARAWEGILFKAGVVLVVSVGFFLRFYQLDTPTLWFDEMFSALSSRAPVTSLLDYAYNSGLHSPYFYLFLKLISAGGNSDFALRWPLATAGSVSVYLVYRLFRGHIGYGPALVAAAFIAVNPIHIWASRQIRPYAFLFLFFCLAIGFLSRFIMNKRRQDFWALLLANLALLSTHYTAFVVVFVEWVVILSLATREWKSMKKGVIEFTAACFLAAIPAIPFMFGLFFKNQMYTVGRQTFSGGFERTVLSIYEVLFLYLPQFVVAALIFLAIFGVVRVYKMNRSICYALLLVFFLPPLIFISVRLNTPVLPVYVLFTALPFSLVLGAAFMARGKAYAAGVLSGLFVLVYGIYYTKIHCHDFYDASNSFASRIFTTGDFKAIAQSLPAVVEDDSVTSASDSFLHESISWYLDQFSKPNPLRHQRIGIIDPVAHYRFLSVGNNFGHFANNIDNFEKFMGQSARVNSVGGANLYSFDIKRTPIIELKSLPMTIELRPIPNDFYRYVSRLEDVTLNPHWGGGVMVTENHRIGTVEYTFDNVENLDGVSFLVWFKYHNVGQDNTLEFLYSFDEEAFISGFVSKGKDVRNVFSMPIRRDTPFKRLTLRFILNCSDVTPQGLFVNLDTLTMRDFKLVACTPAHENYCFMKMSSLTLPSGTEVISIPGQIVGEMSGIVNNLDDDSGWNVYRPENPDVPGIVTINPGKSAAGAIFYPRVSGKSSQVLVYRKVNMERKLVAAYQGIDDKWTDMFQQWPLDPSCFASEEGSLEIELYKSELWHKDGTIFFNLPKD